MIPENKKSLLVNFLLQVMFVGILLGLFRTAVPAYLKVFLTCQRTLLFFFLPIFVQQFANKTFTDYYCIFADKYRKRIILKSP